jgi:hypothetical protein
MDGCFVYCVEATDDTDATFIQTDPLQRGEDGSTRYQLEALVRSSQAVEHCRLQHGASAMEKSARFSFNLVMSVTLLQQWVQSFCLLSGVCRHSEADSDANSFVGQSTLLVLHLISVTGGCRGCVATSGPGRCTGVTNEVICVY